MAAMPGMGAPRASVPLLALLAAPLLAALLLRPAPCQAVPADSNDTGAGPCYRQET